MVSTASGHGSTSLNVNVLGTNTLFAVPVTPVIVTE